MSKIKKKKRSKAAANLSKSTPGVKSPTPSMNTDEVMKEASSYMKSGELQKAAILYGELLKSDENNAKILFLLGTIMAQMGNIKNAAILLNKAILIKPDYHEAYNNFGNVLDAAKDYPQAQKAYKKATELHPEYIDALFNLGCNYKKTYKPEKAAECFEKILKINPSHEKSLEELSPIKNALGYYEDAKKITEKLFSITGHYIHRINACMLMPIILPPRSDITVIRNSYESCLDEALENDIKIENPQTDIRRSSFRLAFHGMNDKHLMLKLGKVYEHISPHLKYVAPHCTGNYYPKIGNKIRIGFISKFFYEHSVSRCYNKLAEDIGARNDFDAFAISTEETGITDSVMESIQTNTAGNITVPNDISTAQKMIADLQLDVLVYTEIGMDNMAYCLAHSRLAPIQAVLPGHPDTTGIDNMDYFLCSSVVEPENGQDHYSEELILFSDTPQHIERQFWPTKTIDRKELDLPSDKNIYTCPMKMQKMHPDFDSTMADILKRDKNGIILLFKENNRFEELITSRLAKNIDSELMDRILIVPYANKEKFEQYIMLSDVVLDPFHFGGGTTCYIVLSLGTPIVSSAGEFVSGRTALSCYKRMGIDGLIANNESEYVDIAIKVATDKEYHHDLQKKILETCDVLFGNESVINEVADFFVKKVKERKLLS